MKPLPPLPKFLLSGRVFSGQWLPDSSLNKDMLDRFTNVDHIKDVLTQAREDKICAVAGTISQPLIQALQFTRFPFIPVIPDVMSINRDSTHHGAMKAGLIRLFQTGLIGTAKIFRKALPKIPALLKRDMTAQLSLLLETELLKISHMVSPVVFLHPTLTDMALAFDNPRLIQSYSDTVAAYDCPAGLSTNNLPHLLTFFERHNLRPAAILAPVNNEGWLMGNLGTLQIKKSLDMQIPIIADRISPYRLPNADDVRFAFKLGITSCVVDYLPEKSNFI